MTFDGILIALSVQRHSQLNIIFIHTQIFISFIIHELHYDLFIKCLFSSYETSAYSTILLDIFEYKKAVPLQLNVI